MSKKFRLTKFEKSKYVMSTEKDFEILAKIKKIEKIKKISNQDRDMIKFIRTQLERDWRAPLLKSLDKILKKYR